MGVGNTGMCVCSELNAILSEGGVCEEKKKTVHLVVEQTGSQTQRVMRFGTNEHRQLPISGRALTFRRVHTRACLHTEDCLSTVLRHSRLTVNMRVALPREGSEVQKMTFG